VLLDHHAHVFVQCDRAVGVLDAEGALFHLFETECHRAIGKPALDELLGHEEGGRAGRAVVVDVVDRDARVAELVEGPLPGRGIAIAVAHRRLLDLLEPDTRVFERSRPSLPRHVGIVPIPGAGLFEFSHANADYVDLLAHVFLTLSAGGAPTGRADSGELECLEFQKGSRT